MFHIGRTLTWFLIGFFFTFIISLFLLTSYVGLELSTDVIVIYAGVSLFVGVVFVGSKRHKVHFGHLPFLLGLLLFFWAGTALFGNLELTTLKKSLWWVISDVTIKRNLAIVTFAGVLFLVAGLKLIGGNLFFLRPFGSRGR